MFFSQLDFDDPSGFLPTQDILGFSDFVGRMGRNDGWMLNSGNLCHQISLIEHGNAMLHYCTLWLRQPKTKMCWGEQGRWQTWKTSLKEEEKWCNTPRATQGLFKLIWQIIPCKEKILLPHCVTESLLLRFAQLCLILAKCSPTCQEINRYSAMTINIFFSFPSSTIRASLYSFHSTNEATKEFDLVTEGQPHKQLS